MNIFGALFKKQKFSSIERAILDAVAEQVTEPWKQVYLQQVDWINRVQRLIEDKEVNFYRKEFGKVMQLPDNLKLPILKTEYRLASLVVVSGEKKYSTKAHLWVVNGSVFSIGFAKSPKNIGSKFHIAKVELLADLSAGLVSSTLPTDCTFPADYLELVKSEEDTCINDWKVLATSNIRTVAERDDNFYILAEKEQGVIGVRSGDLSGELWLIDFQTGEESKIGTALIPHLQTTRRN